MLGTDLLLPLDGDDLAVEGDSLPEVDGACDSLPMGISFKPNRDVNADSLLPGICIEKGNAQEARQEGWILGMGAYCYIDNWMTIQSEQTTMHRPRIAKHWQSRKKHAETENNRSCVHAPAVDLDAAAKGCPFIPDTGEAIIIIRLSHCVFTEDIDIEGRWRDYSTLYDAS